MAICIYLDQLHLAEQPGVGGFMWENMMMELKLAPMVDLDLAI